MISGTYGRDIRALREVLGTIEGKFRDLRETQVPMWEF